MKTMKLALGIMATVAAIALTTPMANAKDKTPTATPGDVKTSNDDSGMKPEEAPHDKVGTIPGKSTPGDVKTSDADSGMKPNEAPNEKVGTIPGASTPGDVKTSNDDSGMNNDDAAHDVVDQKEE